MPDYTVILQLPKDRCPDDHKAMAWWSVYDWRGVANDAIAAIDTAREEAAAELGGTAGAYEPMFACLGHPLDLVPATGAHFRNQPE